MGKHWATLIPDPPLDWCFIPLDGQKRPIDPETGDLLTGWQNHPGYDLDGIAELNGLVKAVGLPLGEKSGGVMAVDFDGPGSEEKFLEVYGRPHTDLPPTIGTTSGKPQRRQLLFLVDLDWWEHLRGIRVWKTGKATVLELRWKGHQSVIAGDHPETSGDSWLPGKAPDEIEMATAPDWLLEPLGMPEQQMPQVEPTAEDAKRAVEMLRFIDPQERTDYEGWLQVGMALHHTDPGLLNAWVD